MAIKFIGCGTARCGSTSLWRLLDDCPGMVVNHERSLIDKRLPYVYDRNLADRTIARFRGQENYGEIAFWFLPYIPTLVAGIPGLKVICLKRDIDDTYRSFIKTIRRDNPWTTKHGKRYTPNLIWDACYPKYDCRLKKAIYRYWHDYYHRVEALEKILPGVKIFDTETLNTRKGQEQIFDFLGVEKGIFKKNCRYNASDSEKERYGGGRRLCELAVKYGTDKVPCNGHSYTPCYDEMFRNKKVEKLLEIGIGYPETMQHIKDYKIGASLRMWEEYFPDAVIYGCDIREDLLVNRGRIKSFVCDQSRKKSLEELVKKTGGNFDIVIDDGSHKTKDQILSAKILLPYMAKGGIYVIEDVKEPDKIKRVFPQCMIRSFLETNSTDDRLIIIW